MLEAGTVGADEAEGTIGRVADAVSTGLKEKTLFSLVLLSTGPADSGGVAVMELGNRTSWRLAMAGESGCAVRGVSGNVEMKGVGAPWGV